MRIAYSFLALAVVLQCGALSRGDDSKSADSRAVQPLKAFAAARQLDSRLNNELFDGRSPATPLTGDMVFLRRLSLDLVGRNPGSRELKEFAANKSPRKRQEKIEEFLAQRRFGENWARYWRDVILARQVDPRAAFVSRSVLSYLTEQFNDGAAWDKIARDFVTAQGDVRENGNTAIYMAQMGRTSETAAEMSRIFMGVQIQCAQCHDHPWDRWKREQFHQFAAFFPRVRVRPVREENRLRSYEVTSSSGSRRRFFSRYRSRSEHYMPVAGNSRSRGRAMEPILFATDQSLKLGASDSDRRQSLARWMTSPRNPYFAKAFVNRIWGELVGVGFYEPLDDLGPDRSSTAPDSLDFLAKQFIANKHNVKWLFQTIAGSQAYQRQSRPRNNDQGSPFATSCAQPLRADQVYNSLTSALGTPSRSMFSRRSRSSRGLQSSVTRTFGFDPSLPRDDVKRSIPQMLFLMNSRSLSQAINARSSRTRLGRLVRGNKNDTEVVGEIYRRTLAREPSQRELKTCLRYIGDVKDRAEAMEDIQWALVNSTEFLFRR